MIDKFTIDIVWQENEEKYQIGGKCKKTEHTAFFGTLNTVVRGSGTHHPALPSPLIPVYPGKQELATGGLWITERPSGAERTVNHD